MRSDARSETLDLARDLPTTAEDTAALRRAKTVRHLDADGYLRFLSQIPDPTPGQQREKSGPRGGQPFRLD